MPIRKINAIIYSLFYEIRLLRYALYAKKSIILAATVPQPTNHHTLISSFIIEERTAPANINFDKSSKYLLIRAYSSCLSFLVMFFGML